MTKYELEEIHLPKLKGRALRWFAGALNASWMRSLLLPRMLRDAGIQRLRERQVSMEPSHDPLHRMPPQARHTDTSVPRPLEVLRALSWPAHRVDEPFVTSAALTEAYRGGRTTPVEVLQGILAAIKASDAGDTPMRAFVAIDEEDAMAQAEASTARWEAGEPLGPLDGVPVAIKDEVDQVPYPTTGGTAFLGQSPASSDSTVVARLREAGALLFGKANMHEIGINPDGMNEHHGQVRNPYDLSRDTGGSSSGSAAAVAAGFCPIAIGADGGGSIRIPAALCGAVGLKPTYGRISEHGAVPLCWSVGHLGPIGATVGDVALMYAAIAGPDPADRNTAHQPPLALEGWESTDLTGLTLGVYSAWFQHADPALVSSCQAMVENMRDAGAEVCEIEIPLLREMQIAHAVTILSEMSSSMTTHSAHFQDFGASTKISLRLGQAFSSDDYLRAQRVRSEAIEVFEKLYAEVDVILTPATAVVAPKIPASRPLEAWSDLSHTTDVMRYVIPGNMVGLPAISFPVGYEASSGLPLSMQAMGNYWQEKSLLQVARFAEIHTERRCPALYHRML